MNRRPTPMCADSIGRGGHCEEQPVPGKASARHSQSRVGIHIGWQSFDVTLVDRFVKVGQNGQTIHNSFRHNRVQTGMALR